MSSARHISHEELLETLIYNGYGDFNPGVCAGYIMTAGQIFLYCVDKDNQYSVPEVFVHRFGSLTQHLKLKDEILPIQIKRQAQTSLTMQEKILANQYNTSHSIFNSIVLFQRANMFQHLFAEKVDWYEFTKIAQVAQTDFIKSKGGLAHVGKTILLVSPYELASLLGQLRILLITHNQPLMVAIDSTIHRVGLGYHAQDKIAFHFDINHPDIAPINLSDDQWTIPNATDLSAAKTICSQAYFLKDDILENIEAQQNQLFLLAFNAFTTKENESILKEIFLSLQNTPAYRLATRITEEKIRFQLGQYNLAMMAVIYNDGDTIKKLLENNAQLIDNILNYSPLHYAAYLRAYEVVDHLLNSGAYVNYICSFGTDSGKTLAHIAVEQGSIEMLRVLDKHKVDWQIVYQNKTPLELAIEAKQLAAADFIQSVFDRDELIRYLLLIRRLIDQQSPYTQRIRSLKNEILKAWKKWDHENKHEVFSNQKEVIWLPKINYLSKEMNSSRKRSSSFSFFPTKRLETTSTNRPKSKSISEYPSRRLTPNNNN